MILSYKHNFLFVKSRKVAGTSLKKVLSKFCAPDDVITRPIQAIHRDQHDTPNYYLKSLKNPPKEAIKTPQGETIEYLLNHTPPLIVRQIIGEALWNQLFKFSIVRNPFDHAASLYAWRSRKDRNPTIDGFRKWLHKANFAKNEMYFVMDKMQGKKEPTGTYQKALDFYVRYEHFEEDLTELSQRLNLPENLWDSFKNIKTKHKIRPTDFTAEKCFKDSPESIALVEKYAKPIMTTFGYESPKA